jgi:twinkle protein
MDRILSKVEIRDTPIEWGKYVLSDEDLQRFVDPSSLVSSISDVLHGRGTRNGIALPLAGLDSHVRIRRGKVALWAGINFHGKTSMLKMLALHMVRCGERPCIASLEEEPEETMADMVQMAIPDTDVRESDDWIDVVCGWLSGKLSIYSQTRMMDPQRILALMAYAAKERGCTHFILDSLMRTGIPQDDYEGQRIFLNQLDNYARQLNIGVQLVHHIVKVDESQVPGRESIRGSGAITDNVPQIFIVWRDVREQKEFDAPDGLLVVAKNRGLRPANWIGKIQLHMHKSGQFMRQKTDRPLQFIAQAQWSPHA